MNRHYGKLGDVWKHLPLAEILRLHPPLHYWETHAGSASYPMTASPERLHGALWFLSHAPTDRILQTCAYLETLQAHPDIYPGSPLIALHALEKNADYLFCDIDPESVRTLREATARVSARMIEGDGVSMVDRESMLARARPTDVLVHIDPFDPHERLTPESKTPIELAGHLAQAGYRMVYWYGYDSVAERGWARSELSRLAPEVQLWCGDALMPAPYIYPDLKGAWGCGVVLANATTEELKACEQLGHALARMSETDVLPNNDPDRLTFEVL